MGTLGFALPAAIGLRMAHPDRPVVAVVGDGSMLYQVMALWSAHRYGAGVVFIVLANGRYAIMDRLAEGHGAAGPWPPLDGIDVGGLARAQGVKTVRVDQRQDLGPVLDRALLAADSATTPLLVEIRLQPDPTFDP
jgi:benzoylformate decarboxylase